MSWLERIESKLYKFFGFIDQDNNKFQNPAFIILAIIMFLAIFFAYMNHFDNGFQFDDSHTIVDNQSIRDVNIKRFFTDGTTFSSVPSNQSYRPYITAENAIDYKFSNGNTRIFHVHIFITFLTVCFLICIFVKKVLDKINFSSRNQFWGLLCSGTFGLLCANAETVNYIIQRAEIVAGLYILAGFVAYLSGGIWQKLHLYLLFPLIGFFAKEMAFVFSPLLFLYVLIFEMNVDLLHFYRKEEFKKLLKSFVKILPSFLLTIIFFLFYSKMLPETFSSGGSDRFKYFITQPMVMCHYIITYFIPYNLSADTDWKPFESLSDYRAIIGFTIVLLLIYLALKASKNKETRLFSFGLLWFFISLLPTSSLLPFSEVLNDHRCFIPYIGLTISFIFGMRYIVVKYFRNISLRPVVKNLVILIFTVFLGLNAYGVRQRNKVWKDDVSLWADVAMKSPANGRGLMNYGLALMAKGDYTNAEIYFNKAAVLNPDYSNVYVNLGILKNAMGDKIASEEFFKQALRCSTANHSSYYFYSKFLEEQGRYQEAVENLKIAYQMSPTYGEIHLQFYSIYHKMENWKDLQYFASKVLSVNPQDKNALKYLDIAAKKETILSIAEQDALKKPTAEKFLSISMQYFQIRQFEKCIEAAEKALKLNANYPEAYNNIGIAYVYLKQYDKGITAYHKALKLNPDYQLTKNNLVYALQLQEAGHSVKEQISAEDYINLSLEYYNKAEYQKCIEAARKSNLIKPSANAYNNICSAYNQLKQFDKAIAACNEALKLDAGHKLANGNRAYAISQKSIK